MLEGPHNNVHQIITRPLVSILSLSGECPVLTFPGIGRDTLIFLACTQTRFLLSGHVVCKLPATSQPCPRAHLDTGKLRYNLLPRALIQS